MQKVVQRATRDREAAVRAAIDACLQLRDHPFSNPPILWGHLAFNSLIYWPIVYLAMGALIGMAWVVAAINEHRVKAIRKTLRAKGLCPRCKPRVDGNLWSARCPECGEPLY